MLISPPFHRFNINFILVIVQNKTKSPVPRNSIHTRGKRKACLVHQLLLVGVWYFEEYSPRSIFHFLGVYLGGGRKFVCISRIFTCCLLDPHFGDSTILLFEFWNRHVVIEIVECEVRVGRQNLRRRCCLLWPDLAVEHPHLLVLILLA